MRRSAKISLVCLVTLVAGCGRPERPPQDLVYTGLSEDLPRLDPGVLEGRRILIDPGHGGHFRGTLGQNGLEESQVNMGVALYLWGLLREAGADAHLTRSAERDFLAVDDSTLASDLAVRVATVDSLQPDILVSIHHNAQQDRDPSKNAVETYYRFGDPGSRDLAFAVHRHLMRNLGIDNGEIKPGNYYILRNIDIPAILGEGSYLTHPGVERALELSSKQRLEAEAYFLGILEYFSRGTPRIALAAPADSILEHVPTLSFRVDDVGGYGIDPAGIDVSINGMHVNAYLNERGDRVSYRMPWDSPNGAYEADVGVRNVLGNASRVNRLHFRLDLPPVSATFDKNPPALPHAGGAIRVRARLLDRRGISVADSTLVKISSKSATVPDSMYVRGGFIEFPATVAPGADNVKVTLLSRGVGFDLVMKRETAAGSEMIRFVIADSLSHEPLHNVTIVAGDSLLANGSHSGTYFLLSDFARGPVAHWFVAPGYEPRQIASENDVPASPDTLFLRPWYNGVLIGRRFVIDPEGGSGSEAGRGPLGLSGPHANLQVAKYAAEYLRAAGARVLLTRTTEQTLSPRDVVDVTNRFGAHRYVEIRHRNAPADSALRVDASFFPGSGTGSAMATAVQTAVASALGLDMRAPVVEVTYPLQQTACPAIVLSYPSIAELDEELRLAEPWYQRLQAYGLFAGILQHFGAEADSALTIRIAAESASNWLVTIDKTWNLLSGPDGTVSFPALGRFRPRLVELRRGERHVVVRPALERPPLTISIPPTSVPGGGQP